MSITHDNVPAPEEAEQKSRKTQRIGKPNTQKYLIYHKPSGNIDFLK
jgi:hypothetical protein